MQRRKFITLAGAGGVAAVAGCSGDGGDGGDGGGGDGTDDGSGGGTSTGTPGGDTSPVTLGAIEPIGFGPFNPWATVHQQGLEIGINEVNESDMLDRDLRLVIADTAADPAQADSTFRRFVEQEDAVAVTGAVSSDVGIRTAQTAAELEVPNLLHMAGSSAILTQDTRYTFRVGWLPSTSHARADADYVAQNDVGSMGAVVADYAWGRSIQSALQEFIPDDVDLQIEVAPLGADDFSSHLRKFPEDIELMNFVGHPSGSTTLVGNMFELGMDQAVLGVDPPQYTLVDIVGENVTNDIITRHLAVPGTDGYNALGQTVADEYDVPMSPYQPIGYMTAKMFGEAVAEVGADPAGIADYIRNGSFDMLYENPLEYTEWGEFKDPVLLYSRFVEGSPPFYPNAQYDLEVVAKTDPLPAPEPGAGN